MNEEKEFGLTNSGDNVVQVPVELKDHSKDPVIAAVPKKKRGRPAKNALTPIEIKPSVTVPSAVTESLPEVKEKPAKEWYCSSCQETISDKEVMKIGAGTNRWAVFCPMCQRAFGFEDQDLQDKVADLIKNNPTGKNAKA